MPVFDFFLSPEYFYQNFAKVAPVETTEAKTETAEAKIEPTKSKGLSVSSFRRVKTSVIVRFHQSAVSLDARFVTYLGNT